MATKSTTESEGRRAELLVMLQQEGVVRLPEASERFGVSAMTIRRDLEALESDGLLRRVRGGAVSVIGPRPFGERRAVAQRAKELIADKAMAFVPQGGSIAFDASSTVGTLAGRLGTRAALIVATNSYQTYSAMRGASGVDPILIGGETEVATDSFVGPIAIHAAESLRYQRFFTSASAIDSRFGTTEVSLREAEVKQAFYRMSRELILLIDSSKLEQQSTAVGFALHDATVLITELHPSDARLDAFRDRIELR